jgi:hypothetical protein
MADISIKKLNESFVEIAAQEDIMFNIYSRYSEYVAGYQFQPRYKLHVWDRKAPFLQYAYRYSPHWSYERLVAVV